MSAADLYQAVRVDWARALLRSLSPSPVRGAGARLVRQGLLR